MYDDRETIPYPRDDLFLDRFHLWSMLCKVTPWAEQTKPTWYVIVGFRSEDGREFPIDHPNWLPFSALPILRPVRWWSPRDLVRFPLHWWWARRYW